MKKIKYWIDENTDLSVRSVLEVLGIIFKAVYDGIIFLMVFEFLIRNFK